jgi:hypothetical protein
LWLNRGVLRTWAVLISLDLFALFLIAMAARAIWSAFL